MKRRQNEPETRPQPGNKEQTSTPVRKTQQKNESGDKRTYLIILGKNIVNKMQGFRQRRQKYRIKEDFRRNRKPDRKEERRDNVLLLLKTPEECKPDDRRAFYQQNQLCHIHRVKSSPFPSYSLRNQEVPLRQLLPGYFVELPLVQIRPASHSCLEPTHGGMFF